MSLVDKLIKHIDLTPIPFPWCLLAELWRRKVWLLWQHWFSKVAFSILLANFDTCDRKTVANWKVEIEKGKYGPMGEDLFAEICLRKTGVAMTDAFDISKDGMCAAKRPANLKHSKKWKPDCASTSSPAIHPFKKPADMKHAWRQQH